MECKIWKQLIQILLYRNDLIDNINPLLENLINEYKKERYSINEQKYIPFLQTLSKTQIELLHKYEIINQEMYSSFIPKNEPMFPFDEEEEYSTSSEESSKSSEESSEGNEEIVNKIQIIIKRDNLEEMQQLVMEKDIKTISPIIKQFNEVKIAIPIIHYCVIENAMQCFKFLLINGIEDPTTTMQEQKPEQYYDINLVQWHTLKKYEWDCMCIGIYYGKPTFVRVLEEKGIEKGKNPAHIEAAILSYRNAIVKELISELKGKNEQLINGFLTTGLIASITSNNIKAIELLFNNGAKANTMAIRGGKIPLNYAVENNSKEIFEILLSKGADINAKDINY